VQKLRLQSYLNSFTTLLVFNYFPAEDLSIWWNITNLIISLVSYMACMNRFTSVWYQSIKF